MSLKKRRVRSVAKTNNETKSEGKAVDLEYAINYLIGMSILSRNEKIQESQKKSLKPWVDYFKENDYDFRFIKLVLGSLMNFDVNWENRGNNDSVDFPTFPTNGPAILAKIYTYYKESFATPPSNPHDIVRRLGLLPGDLDLIKGKSFKDLFFFFQRKELLSAEFRKTAVVVPGTGRWQKKFSYLNADRKKISEDDKKNIAIDLSEACENCDELCLKGYSKAREYLEEGDIEVYSVTKKGIREGKVVMFDVVEIAIHVKRDAKTNEEFINPREIHGNAENQGINPQYLEIARAFVNQKKKDENGKETDEYRFTNAQEFDIKFADTIMYNRVKDKIEKLGNSDENGKPYPDLEPNELKFLYQIYRPVEGFELGGGWGTGGLDEKVKSLKYLRQQKIGNKGIDFKIAEDHQGKKDMAKIFDIDSNDVIDYRGGGDFSVFEYWEKVSGERRYMVIGYPDEHVMKLIKTNIVNIVDVLGRQVVGNFYVYYHHKLKKELAFLRYI